MDISHIFILISFCISAEILLRRIDQMAGGTDIFVNQDYFFMRVYNICRIAYLSGY